jgi:serine/threonine protein kinase
MTGCPDASVLADLVERALPSEAGADVRAHLDGCDACRRTVAMLVRERRPAPASAAATVHVELPPAPDAPTGGAVRTLAPGTLFARRFVIEVAAGGGGMGRVYRARDQQSGDLVALKIIASVDASERFDREAELLAAVRHPAVVAYVAHGVTPEGERYLAMEWLEGMDLATRLRGGPLSVGETAALLRRVAGALAPAHERGIVHRDVKPSNLFLPGGEVGRVKLLDFGIARRAAGVTLTGAGALVGTPGYMAPEQVRGERDITPAADVFALGCVLYECLTGRAPFTGDHVAAALVRLLFDDVTPIGALRPSVPGALAHLVERMLRKPAAERPPDAAALVQELGALAVGAELDATPVPAREPALTSAEQGLYSLVVALPPGGGSTDATVDAGRAAPPPR